MADWATGSRTFAPFFGAPLAMPLLGEAWSMHLNAAGALMALGVWLHLTERHSHAHTDEPITHVHDHFPDAHHRHGHRGARPADPVA